MSKIHCVKCLVCYHDKCDNCFEHRLEVFKQPDIYLKFYKTYEEMINKCIDHNLDRKSKRIFMEMTGKQKSYDMTCLEYIIYKLYNYLIWNLDDYNKAKKEINVYVNPKINIYLPKKIKEILINCNKNYYEQVNIKFSGKFYNFDELMKMWKGDRQKLFNMFLTYRCKKNQYINLEQICRISNYIEIKIKPKILSQYLRKSHRNSLSRFVIVYYAAFKGIYINVIDKAKIMYDELCLYRKKFIYFLRILKKIHIFIPKLIKVYILEKCFMNY